ncbi:MAG: protease HtpX [Myxococcota bacterium]
MNLAKRLLLFTVTNIAVLLLLSIVMSVFGVGGYVSQHGLSIPDLLVFSAVLGFGGSLISLAISKWLAKTMMRVRVIHQPSNEVEDWLVRTVGHLSRQAGITTPEVGVYPSRDMNAFATGARRNSALVAVSTGLLQRMKRDEVEAVLAHEISHCSNGDMVTLTLLQGVLNTFVVFLSRVAGFFVDKLVFRSERGTGIGYFLTVILTQIFLGILASFVVAAFSRRREYRADEGAARLVGSRPMISALDALRRATVPPAMPESMRAFGIRGGGGGMRALLATHPPLEERIERLRSLG